MALFSLFPSVGFCFGIRVQISSINIADPVDLKATTDGNLYVLSRNTASIIQYDAVGTIIRSITGIGSAPRGLDVDSAGNVYVAVTGDNLVWKFNPSGSSFQADTTFNITGHIGSSGTGPSQFNAPFDVAVTPDSEEIAVSDSGNHRVQRFTKNGIFIDSFWQSETGIGQFSTPKGLTYDPYGTLYIVDSGNNRIAFARSSAVLRTGGSLELYWGSFKERSILALEIVEFTSPILAMIEFRNLILLHPALYRLTHDGHYLLGWVLTSQTPW